MSFDLALRLTEVIMAAVFMQQCAEHWVSDPRYRGLYGARALGCVLLIGGVTVPALLILCAASLFMLHRFDGPYNGGSDKMSLLILWCLMGVHLAPNVVVKEAVFAYLAVQLTLSYFISGQVKIMNVEWRTGRALQDVFAYSAYPVAEDMRGLAERPQLLWGMSWAVIGFEVAFPLALLHPMLLLIALGIGATFHLANAVLFGLNRFFWIWLAAYPSLVWFQGRVIAPLL